MPVSWAAARFILLAGEGLGNYFNIPIIADRAVPTVDISDTIPE